MLLNNLSNDLLRYIIFYLDLFSSLKLKEVSQYFYFLEISDLYYKNILNKQFQSNLNYLILKKDITYLNILKKLYKEIYINWFDVFTDSYFYYCFFGLHTNNCSQDIFYYYPPSKSLKKLLNEEGYLNSCEDNELNDELFESNSNVYSYFLDFSTFTFQLPEGNTLKFIVGAEGLYFHLNNIDIGRIDGHHCMPALRWEECKKIAKYQKIVSPFTYDHIILILSLLAYPEESILDDYLLVTSTALKNTKILVDEEKLNLFAESLESTFDWTYDDNIQAWIHPWGARSIHNPDTARQVHQILSLLDNNV